jgi:hypothetical protein
MTSKLRIAAVVALLLALPGCAGRPDSKPSWSEAPDVDVAGYSTFGWADRGGKAPVTILDNQIRHAVRAQLTEKGYVESSDDPDFLVGHETIEQETVKQGSPVRIGFGVGSIGGNVGGSVGTSVDVGEKGGLERQMRITIRALNQDNRNEEWVGTTGSVEERPEEDDVERAVAGVMKGFPDKRL